MNLAELGEDRLVALLTKGLGSGGNVRVGIGDDCAVIGSPRAKVWQLLKTDCVIEGIHFLPDADPRKIGWKAMARVLSDIAAMSGVPESALITIAARRDLPVKTLTSIYAGMRKAARQFRFQIVGGETSRSPGPLFISIAMAGSVERKRCVLRSGGRPGDALYVTGKLGGLQRHLDFTPRLRESRWITESFCVHAMMDVSDGLASDLPRLAFASRVAFTIYENAIPRAPGCALREAMSDGEDYELLFAIAPKNCADLERKWRRKFPKLPLTRIGELTQGTATIPASGYDHFQQR
jgi:thiamine-monophosphate kinase